MLGFLFLRIANTHIVVLQGKFMRDRINDTLTIIGTGLASLTSAGIIPAEYGTLAALGGGVGIAALLEKEWRKHKDAIIEEIEDFVEDKTGLDVELDNVVEEVADAVIDTVKDFAEDGDLDTSLSDRADALKSSLQKLTVKELKSQLKERGLSLDGKKADLVERLLNAGEE